jgi:hypothetical protein
MDEVIASFSRIGKFHLGGSPMAYEKEKEELRDKLARYESLARQFQDSATGENIRKAIEDLQRQLRALDQR